MRISNRITILRQNLVRGLIMSSHQTTLIISYLKSDKGEDRIASDWIDGIDRALPNNNKNVLA